MNPHVNAIANRLSLRQPQRDRSGDPRPGLRDRPAGEGRGLRQGPGDHPLRIPHGRRTSSGLPVALLRPRHRRRQDAADGCVHRLPLPGREGIRHFFVLAPNLTIYNKLIADFTPNTPKYVFQGIAEFAINPPEIITGDNYESAVTAIRGAAMLVRRRARSTSTSSTSRRSTPRSAATRPRGSSGCPSTSARATSSTCPKLDDLVLLMDESHRYRASAGRQGDQRTEADPRPGTDRHAAGREGQQDRAVQERHLQLPALARR